MYDHRHTRQQTQAPLGQRWLHEESGRARHRGGDLLPSFDSGWAHRPRGLGGHAKLPCLLVLHCARGFVRCRDPGRRHSRSTWDTTWPEPSVQEADFTISLCSWLPAAVVLWAAGLCWGSGSRWGASLGARGLPPISRLRRQGGGTPWRESPTPKPPG